MRNLIDFEIKMCAQDAYYDIYVVVFNTTDSWLTYRIAESLRGQFGNGGNKRIVRIDSDCVCVNIKTDNAVWSDDNLVEWLENNGDEYINTSQIKMDLRFGPNSIPYWKEAPAETKYEIITVANIKYKIVDMLARFSKPWVPTDHRVLNAYEKEEKYPYATPEGGLMFAERIDD